MTINEILKEWLQDHEYNGLCFPDFECGCGIDDLMPCGEPNPRCEPGHFVDSPTEEFPDGHYSIRKPEETDAG